MRAINFMRKNRLQVGASAHLIYELGGRFHIHEDIFEVAKVSKDEEGYHYSLKNSYDDPIDWCYERYVFNTRQEAEMAVARLNLILGEYDEQASNGTTID